MSNPLGLADEFAILGADGARTHIGLFGGTFDPIHLGHLIVAEQVRDAFGLDAVIFIPTAVPSYKNRMPILEPDERLALCALAIADNPHFDVSDVDVRRGGSTYTIDTLTTFRSWYPDNVRLSFIVGADSARMIHTWHQSERLPELADFIAVTRPGYTLDVLAADSLAEQFGFEVQRLRISGLAVSSSDVRERIREHRSIRYLVPDAVREYIGGRRLYE